MSSKTAGERSSGRLPGAAALTVLLLSGSLLVAAGPWPGGNPHLSFADAANCPRCHLYRGGRIELRRFSADSDSYCVECHPGAALGRTHPTGGRPEERYRGKMRIPDDFPLDDRGALMCLTCHAAHGPAHSPLRLYPSQKGEGQGGAGRYRTLFLRRTGSKDGFAALCDECHRKL